MSVLPSQDQTGTNVAVVRGSSILSDLEGGFIVFILSGMTSEEHQTCERLHLGEPLLQRLYVVVSRR